MHAYSCVLSCSMQHKQSHIQIQQELRWINLMTVHLRLCCCAPSQHACRCPAALQLHHELHHFCSLPRDISCSRLASTLCCFSCSYSFLGRNMETAVKWVPGWLHLRAEGREGVDGGGAWCYKVPLYRACSLPSVCA